MMHCKTKNEVREYARSLRKAIPLLRRDEAHHAFMQTLPSYQELPNILSYASFGDEFDTWQINRRLMEQGRLLLPKTDDSGVIRAFRVTDIDSQLKEGLCGIMEPDPALCEEVSALDISLVFVPALAFDNRKHRVGYGKGCYDRFLSGVSRSTQFFGIGYKEQLLQFPIPVDACDVFLTEICLF